MKSKIVAGVLLLCAGLLCAWVIQLRVAAQSAAALAVAPRWVSAPIGKPFSLGNKQFAYVSSSKGIYEYRVAQNGRLEPLTGKPVKGSPVNARLCADPQTGALFAISDSDNFVEQPITDRIYCYIVGKNGLLTPPASGPMKAELSVLVAKLDSRHHLLYLLGLSYADGQDKVVVYDVSHPAALVKRQTVAVSVERDAPVFGNVILNQEGTALFLLGRRNSTDGQHIYGEVQFYPIISSNALPLGSSNLAQTDLPLGSCVTAENYLILGDRGNQLTVCKSIGKTFEVVSVTPPSKTLSGPGLGNLAYRKSGSILYVGSYIAIDTPRVPPPPSAISAYRLGKNGSLEPLPLANAPKAPYPAVFLDNSERFLYIISADDKIVAYKTASDGQLSFAGTLLKVASPNNIVFFGGVPPKG